MVMLEQDLDLEKNRELLKSVRRGEWTLDRLEEWFKARQLQLDGLYVSSDLRLTADVVTIKSLLMNCLEAKFGSLSAYFNVQGSDKIAHDNLAEIEVIVNR